MQERARFRKGFPTPVVGLNITVILLLVVLNGVLAMTELAIVSARTGRLQQMAANGNKGAATAIELAADPGKFLSSVQIGITLIGIANGAFGGATLTEPMANLLSKIPGIESSSKSIAGLVVVVLITYLSLIIGELVPKRIALQRAESIAATMAGPMKAVSTAFKPIVWFLAVSNDAVLALLRIKESDEPNITEDEIRVMLMQATDAGVFERAEQEMVAGVFGLGDRTAGELMTPRHAISWLDIAESDASNIRTISKGNYALYPVIDDEPDNVVGVVSTRDILQQSLSGEPLSIRKAVKPALFVPEILPVLQVLRAMRDTKTNMAIVIDEYGGFEGIITNNDVISGMVDELGSDDIDRQEEIEGVSQLPDGTWQVRGQLGAHQFRELFGIKELDGEEAGRFETIAGYILDKLGHIPNLGEAVEADGYRIEVVAMDGYRIETVKVTPPVNNRTGEE
ncbi:MAG: HlyC/CorC family transporter [Thermomicrobiales bacterium]|nr:HlyC/CorC family transporter [Thermomicrobiales bacterium]